MVGQDQALVADPGSGTSDPGWLVRLVAGQDQTLVVGLDHQVVGQDQAPGLVQVRIRQWWSWSATWPDRPPNGWS